MQADTGSISPSSLQAARRHAPVSFVLRDLVPLTAVSGLALGVTMLISGLTH